MKRRDENDEFDFDCRYHIVWQMLTVRDDLSSYGKKTSRDSQRRLEGYELCFFQIAFLAILITNYELGKW